MIKKGNKYARCDQIIASIIDEQQCTKVLLAIVKNWQLSEQDAQM